MNAWRLVAVVSTFNYMNIRVAFRSFILPVEDITRLFVRVDAVEGIRFRDVCVASKVAS